MNDTKNVINEMLATKTDLINKLAEYKGYTKTASKKAVEDMVDILPKILVEYGGIQIIGLGSLEVKTRKAKIGRNPKTNEEIPLPERKFIKFKAGKLLKEAIE